MTATSLAPARPCRWRVLPDRGHPGPLKIMMRARRPAVRQDMTDGPRRELRKCADATKPLKTRHRTPTRDRAVRPLRQCADADGVYLPDRGPPGPLKIMMRAGRPAVRQDMRRPPARIAEMRQWTKPLKTRHRTPP